jgi:FixJ family two-component response regulator
VNADESIIFVVDDDPSVRKSLGRLLRTAGYAAETFACVRDFLGREHHDGPGCLVLDVCLPGISGLDAVADLAQARYYLPKVFITGHADVPTSVRAMKSGAVDFLSKPFREDELLGAVRAALEKEQQERGARAELQQICERVKSLTLREQEVLEYVVAGQLNKQIAAALGVAEKTIKVHRARVMQKMQAATFADLVRMAGKAGIPSERYQRDRLGDGR